MLNMSMFTVLSAKISPHCSMLPNLRLIKTDLQDHNTGSTRWQMKVWSSFWAGATPGKYHDELQIWPWIIAPFPKLCAWNSWTKIFLKHVKVAGMTLVKWFHLARDLITGRVLQSYVRSIAKRNTIQSRSAITKTRLAAGKILVPCWWERQYLFLCHLLLLNIS